MLQQLIGPVTGLLDKFIEDKDKKNAIAFELSTMAEKHAQELAKAQLEVNKTEAAHKKPICVGLETCCWLDLLYWTCESVHSYPDGKFCACSCRFYH